MISNNKLNNTNLNLSYHPPNPCLLLLPRSLMLSPSPLPFPLSLSLSTFKCHTQTQISSDSTGRPGQTRRFLAVIWIETVLVHFLEWPAENSMHVTLTLLTVSQMRSYWNLTVKKIQLRHLPTYLVHTNEFLPPPPPPFLQWGCWQKCHKFTVPIPQQHSHQRPVASGVITGC